MLLLIFLACWLGLCTFAIWRGGQPERLAGVFFLVAYPLSVASNMAGLRLGGANVGVMAVDVLLLIGLVGIALRADRHWPMAMAGMQVLQVSCHILRLADPTPPPLLYWLTKVIWAFPMLVLLTIATVRHRGREKRLGPEPSWVSSSTASSTRQTRARPPSSRSSAA